MLACTLELALMLLELLVAAYPGQPGKPAPCLDTDTDDWKCPSAEEIARVVAQARGRREPGSSGRSDVAALLKDGSDSEALPLALPASAEPLWDRELDG